MPVININKQIFGNGAKARKQGKSRNENPYSCLNDKWDIWAAGWQSIEDAIQDATKQGNTSPYQPRRAQA